MLLLIGESFGSQIEILNLMVNSIKLIKVFKFVFSPIGWYYELGRLERSIKLFLFDFHISQLQ